jgi:hypothetical protein
MTNNSQNLLQRDIKKVQSEFGLSQASAYRRVKEAGLSDAPWTTVEIVRAIYGDLRIEKTKLAAAQRKIMERREQVQAGEMVNLRELAPVLIDSLTQLRSIFEDSHVTDYECERLYGGLNNIGRDLAADCERLQKVANYES